MIRNFDKKAMNGMNVPIKLRGAFATNCSIGMRDHDISKAL